MGHADRIIAVTIFAFAPLQVAQAQSSELPLTVAPAKAGPVTVLRANTEVLLSMNDTISTKGKRWNDGDNFDMTVTHDVRFGQYVVIPRGSRGVGHVSWMTNKGAFGKSGKLEIDIDYVEVGGRRIPLSGHYRQEGEGNTVATVGTVLAAGVFAGFVTGKSGVIPQGRELIARTKEDLPLAIEGPMPEAGDVPLQVSAPAARSNAMVPSAPRARSRGTNPRVKCVTC